MTPTIPAAEFKSRQAAFAKELQYRGLDAAIVWSRGGTSHEFYGDVLYLTNHHTQVQSMEIRDLPGWRSHGIAAAVVYGDGKTVVFTDGEFSQEATVASDIRLTLNLPQDLAQSVAAEVGEGRVGIAGRDSLLAVHFDDLRKQLPAAIELTASDSILQRMRAIKSPAELAMIRHAADVGVGWMKASMEAVVAGCTEGQVVGAGLAFLAANGGTQYDVAIAGGARSDRYWGSSNIPHWDATTPLNNGDLIHIDNWGPVNGYYTDIARSTVIGRRPTSAQRRVLEGSVSLVEYIIEAIRPGVTALEVLDLRAVWLKENGFTPPLTLVEALAALAANDSSGDWRRRWPGGMGHSMGLAIETPMIVYGDDMTFQPNMVMAIETHISLPGVGASNFEQNVIVTTDGCELLTGDLPTRWWD